MSKSTISKETVLRTGIILSLLTVAFGAFGAHALSDILIENERTDTFKTAIIYQMFHSIAIILTAILVDSYLIEKLRIAFYLFVSGIVFFSGSLYILSITNIGLFGAITPIGGVLFIVGWVYLLLSLKKS